MNAKSTIRRILFISIWLCIGGGMLTLLLAAISKKNKGRCSAYLVNLKGEEQNLFIDVKDVEQLVMKTTGGNIKGALITSINLQQLERDLEKNSWVRDAELYFDNKDVLHITVVGKAPAARIFTVLGNSFYIDSLGQKIPLSAKFSAKVPVFTGFPDKKVLTARDSLLLDEVRHTANFILQDPFWMAQVAQIDITSDRTFEMIPVVGHHTVKLGNGHDIDKKFHRLYLFYQQVLSPAGFNKYKIINVEYAGQVIASQQSVNAKIDSIQLRKNVDKLLRQSRENQVDTLAQLKPRPGKPIVLEKDSISTPSTEPKTTTLEKADPNAMKATSLSTMDKKVNEKPVTTDKPKKEEPQKVPKAVMPPRKTTDESGGNN